MAAQAWHLLGRGPKPRRSVRAEGSGPELSADRDHGAGRPGGAVEVVFPNGTRVLVPGRDQATLSAVLAALASSSREDRLMLSFPPGIQVFMAVERGRHAKELQRFVARPWKPSSSGTCWMATCSCFSIVSATGSRSCGGTVMDWPFLRSDWSVGITRCRGTRRGRKDCSSMPRNWDSCSAASNSMRRSGVATLGPRPSQAEESRASSTARELSYFSAARNLAACGHKGSCRMHLLCRPIWPRAMR